jgi:antitoxin (DNA-binding transcriptional repressor) of toxin-antitoxin stability system
VLLRAGLALLIQAVEQGDQFTLTVLLGILVDQE